MDHEAKIVLSIPQHEAKEATALLAHLRNIYRVIRHEKGWIVPTSMDQADLLLCAASLRALLLDKKPILITFLRRHSLKFDVETFESTANLALTTKVTADDDSLADGLSGLMLDPDFREKAPFNEEYDVFAVLEGSTGFARMKAKRQLWKANQEIAPGSEVIHSIGSISGPAQFLQLVRTKCDLEEWSKKRVGFLGALPIGRGALIRYVANQLGGVHFESPKNLPKDCEDREIFPAMVRYLDWQDQAVVHGFIACVGWLSIELMRTIKIVELMLSLQNFHDNRYARLQNQLRSDEMKN